MRIKLICCDVFARLAYAFTASSPHVVDLELLPMLAHNEPHKLRAALQAAINRAGSQGTDSLNFGEPIRYDCILLGYGLCGNASSGLVNTATVSVIIPRMHDCCAMFIGSRERFIEVFGARLSTRWCTCGYFERGLSANTDDVLDYKTRPEYLKMLEEYGEENAEYVWTTLNPPHENKEAIYIHIDGFEYNNTRKSFEQYIETKESQNGCEILLEEVSAGWFERLVNGPWDESDFLEIKPGQTVSPVYDMEEVFRTI